MNSVNLNGPDLKLVSSTAPARASVLPQSEGASSTTASASVDRSSVVQAERVQQLSDAEKPMAPASESPSRPLDEAVSKLNDYVQSIKRDLQFEVDNERGQTIVKVVDQETRQVIRQIPDEVALRLAENLHQDEPLTLFNIKV